MSQYSNGYVVSIVIDNQLVASRMDNIVVVPFGADYVIRLKNNNENDALAKVHVDGQNVTGGGIIVRARNTIDLERPTDKPVTFRFASTESQAAKEHGKAGPDIYGDKGLIKVEWFPEKEYRPLIERKLDFNPYDHNRYTFPYKVINRYSGMRSGRTSSLNLSPNYVPGGEGEVYCGASRSSSLHSHELQSGVTVEGGYSQQMFNYTYFEADYTKPTVILIKLKGYSPSVEIPREGTRYCSKCGT